MTKSLLLALAVSAASLAAADVNGKWTATIESPRGEMKMDFDFKADGEKLTGTIANAMMGSSDIQDGKIDGDNIEFKQAVQFGDREMKFLYTGKVSGDEITFTRKMDGGGFGGGAGQGKGGGKGGRKGGMGGPREFKATRAK
ncbi:MAG: hypothetical protein R2729_24450 [Bryobacteraceae bacterium]